jgi:hypothetical protein
MDHYNFNFFNHSAFPFHLQFSILLTNENAFITRRETRNSCVYTNSLIEIFLINDNLSNYSNDC